MQLQAPKHPPLSASGQDCFITSIGCSGHAFKPAWLALASMCRFLKGFASYGSACAGALVVLETPQTILSLEKRLLLPPNYISPKQPPSSESQASLYNAHKQVDTAKMSTSSMDEAKVAVHALLDIISANHRGVIDCASPPLKMTESVIHNDDANLDIGPICLAPDEQQPTVANPTGTDSNDCVTAMLQVNDASIVTSEMAKLCRCGTSHSIRRNRKRPLHPLAHAPKTERLCFAVPPYLERIVIGGDPGSNEVGPPNQAQAQSPIRAVARRCSSGKRRNESFHCPCSHEPSNVPTAGDTQYANMHTIYVGKSAAGRGMQSRLATPVPYTVPEGGIGMPFKHSLLFDASFESANLLSAVQRGPAEYDLFLRADLHTDGFMQWFYFGITNTCPRDHLDSRHSVESIGVDICNLFVPPCITFNIVNLTKPESLFNTGMQPVIYSCADAAEHGIGWIRSGSHVEYRSNQYVRNGLNSSTADGATYYTLSFTLAFDRSDDVYLIAHSYPYTYSDHKAHLASMLRSLRKRRIVQHALLCTTLDGQDCDLITITGDADELPGVVELSSSAPSFLRRKKTVILSARVHPGETPASWMMRGILDFLVGDSHEARILRALFVFKIVPMLNPDGVLYGNNRCSLAGVDLNR